MGKINLKRILLRPEIFINLIINYLILKQNNLMNKNEFEIAKIKLKKDFPTTYQKIKDQHHDVDFKQYLVLDRFFYNYGIIPVSPSILTNNRIGYLGEIHFLPNNKLNRSTDEVIEVITDPKKYKLPEKALKEVFLKALDILESHFNISTAQ
jgi:hypothetical protein